jgi:hypothetical protein
VSFTDNVRAVARVIMGLVIAAAAVYVGWVALHQKPIVLNLVYFAGGGLLLAGLVGDADPVYNAAKRLVSLLPQIKIGGGGGTPAP